MARPRDIPIAERLLRLDVLAGLVVGVIALAILIESAGLAIGEIRNFGPGFLPRVLGSILAAGALILIARGLAQPEDQAERVRLALRGPGMVALGILFFALFIRGWHLGPVPTPRLGVLIVGPVTIVLAGLGSREGEVRELVVLGFGLTGAATLLFADLLNMQLPIFPGFVDEAITTTFGTDWPKRLAYLACFAVAYLLLRAFDLRLSLSAED